MTTKRSAILVAALAGTLGLSTVCRSAPVTPMPTTVSPPAAPAPLTIFISDLHFGLGKLDSGAWNPLEDFRWSDALKGFLKEISSQSGSKTTLVIAGDMLELWQHPDLDCASGDANRGCTVDEIASLTQTIVAAHLADLEALGRFASEGQNHLVIIPGNHDAALLVKRVRDQVMSALKANPGTVTFVDSGVWSSPDGRLVSEHGHQMPNEQINGWKKWPVVTETFEGREYLIRPWGEYFVHKLYDTVEVHNSLIDNLIPQSNGVRHYMKQEGTWGSAKDIARFLAFNIGETSLSQLGALKINASKGPPVWDAPGARKKGWQLFASAAPKDSYRSQLYDVNNSGWNEVRHELDLLAGDSDAISDVEVRSLCDKSATNESPGPGICPREDAALVIGAIAGAVPGASCRAISSHLATRSEEFPKMRVFVYGHTHELQCPFPVTPKGGLPVIVANTGAFQRLIDDAMFVAAAKQKGLTPEQGLQRLTLEDDAPACYSAVLVTYQDNRPSARVKNWLMKEGDASGIFVNPGDSRCAKLGSCDPNKTCQ